jgi:hypothetical protein
MPPARSWEAGPVSKRVAERAHRRQETAAGGAIAFASAESYRDAARLGRHAYGELGGDARASVAGAIRCGLPAADHARAPPAARYHVLTQRRRGHGGALGQGA